MTSTKALSNAIVGWAADFKSPLVLLGYCGDCEGCGYCKRMEVFWESRRHQDCSLYRKSPTFLLGYYCFSHDIKCLQRSGSGVLFFTNTSRVSLLCKCSIRRIFAFTQTSSYPPNGHLLIRGKNVMSYGSRKPMAALKGGREVLEVKG